MPKKIDTSFFQRFIGFVKDNRVPWSYKLLLVGAAAYLLWPFDIWSDLVPVIGQIDDAAVVTGLISLFMNIARKKVETEDGEESISGKAVEYRKDGDTWKERGEEE